MINDIDSEVAVTVHEAKAIHFDERRITLRSVKLVAKLDEMRAWHYLGLTTDQLALEIGLSPSQFYKRLKAFKIMNEYPAALEAFEKGQTQISHIAMIGNRITPANADVILEGIKNRSKREVEDLLSRVCSNGLLREHEGIVETTLRMTESQAAVIARVKEVQASCGNNPSMVAAILCAAEMFLNLKDPMRIAERAAEREAIKEKRRAEKMKSESVACESFQSKSAQTVNCEWSEHAKQSDEWYEEPAIAEVRDLDDDAMELNQSSTPIVANEPGENYTPDELKELTPLERIRIKFKNKRRDPRQPIRAAVKYRVWLRDEGRCTFMHGNGERCKERKSLELDHRIMVCRGGGNDEDNLTLRCRYHNNFLAEQELGRKFMEGKKKRQDGANGV